MLLHAMHDQKSHTHPVRILSGGGQWHKQLSPMLQARSGSVKAEGWPDPRNGFAPLRLNLITPRSYEVCLTCKSWTTNLIACHQPAFQHRQLLDAPAEKRAVSKLPRHLEPYMCWNGLSFPLS